MFNDSKGFIHEDFHVIQHCNGNFQAEDIWTDNFVNRWAAFMRPVIGVLSRIQSDWELSSFIRALPTIIFNKDLIPSFE